MPIDATFWRGRRVLVTGHTGFKGGWLTLWLHALGARVTGLALAPPPGPAMYTAAQVDDACDSRIVDLRDALRVAAVVRDCRPEVVLHLAAQPLVRASYGSAADTWMTNVMGTIFLLDALRDAGTARAIVVVTSDKCYANDGADDGARDGAGHGATRAFREDDRLGGHDPYSSSKAAVELAAASWRRSFFADAGLATARAGNVIGGGDWAIDRLVPDLVRATRAGTSVPIRSPSATRPWQHVLDPLDGYLRLAERLFDRPDAYAGAWNFGPDANDAWRVDEVADAFAASLDRGTRWHAAGGATVHEAATLALDSGKARAALGWSPAFTTDDAIRATAEAYRTELDGGSLRDVVLRQIASHRAIVEAEPVA